MTFEKSNSLRQKTFPELAQDALMNSDPERFLNSFIPTKDSYLLELTLFYFQALGSIMGKIYSKRKVPITYSMEQMDIFNKNKSILEAVKFEIEDLNLTQLLSKYNEAVIISGLVYSIRSIEASIKNYDKYLRLKSKFLSWPKIGINSIRVIEAWKDFNNSLTEMDQWLMDKKQFYMQSVETIIHEFETNPGVTSERLYSIIKGLIKEDKEIFYCIANILVTNPLLHNEILNLSQLDKRIYLKFEKLIFGMLQYLNINNYNEMLSNMIILFSKQIKYERPDIDSD